TVAPWSSPPSSKLYGASPAKPTVIFPASWRRLSRSPPPSSLPPVSPPPVLVRLQAARPPSAAADRARPLPRMKLRRFCVEVLPWAVSRGQYRQWPDTLHASDHPSI